MDEKTLKYMGDRVDRARVLKAEMDKCQGYIDRITKNGISGVITSDMKGYTRSRTDFCEGVKDYRGRMIENMKFDIVGRLAEFKAELQEELDEL